MSRAAGSAGRLHRHPSDAAAYQLIDQLNAEHKIKPLPYPLPRGGTEPRLNPAQVFGGNTAAVSRIQSGGQIVFHATGDCGSTRGPKTPRDRESAEEAQLHDARLLFIELEQALQGGIDTQHVHLRSVGHIFRLTQGDPQAAPTFAGEPAAGMIDEHLAHHA